MSAPIVANVAGARWALVITNADGDTCPVLVGDKLTASDGDVIRVQGVREGGVLTGHWVRYNGRQPMIAPWGSVSPSEVSAFPGVAWVRAGVTA